MREGGRDVYAFFKHEETPAGALYAEELLRQVACDVDADGALRRLRSRPWKGGLQYPLLLDRLLVDVIDDNHGDGSFGFDELQA